MYWVIQDDFYRLEGMRELCRVLERCGLPHSVVGFDETRTILTRDIRPAGRVMVCGSLTMTKIAASRGWTPGSFHNGNHDVRVWQEAFGDELLNAGATSCRLADVDTDLPRFFIRPCGDSKEFAGLVFGKAEFAAWRERKLNGTRTSGTLSADTMVSYAPVRTILDECRFFVVDGRIVADTTYRVGNLIASGGFVNDDTRAFAARTIARWQPARAFVIDVARIVGERPGEDDHKIVEINCINSSGFYGINVQKFVEAIEAMDFAEASPPAG